MFDKRYNLHLVPEITSANLVFGKAVHKVWANWLLAWHEGEDFDMQAAFEEEWHKRTSSEAIEYNSGMKEENFLALGREFGKLFPEAWDRSGLILAVDKQEQPLVERHLMIRYQGILIQGYLDLVALDQDGRCCILDVKTPASITGEEYSLMADQLTLYEILVEANRPTLGIGKVHQLGFFEGIKRKVGGRKGPEVLPPAWVSARTQAQKEAYLKKVVWIEHQIREGQFHQRSLGAFDSPCKLCDYRALCATGSMEGLMESDERREREAALQAKIA